MNRILKFIRGTIGMGLIFAGGISGVFSVVVVLKWLLLGSDLWHEMIETVLTGTAPIGFGVGLVFSGGLALFGRHRTLAEMSIWPFVASGAAAGFLLRLPFIPFTWESVLFDAHLLTLLGAGSAAGVFALVRRDGSRESISSGEGPDLLKEG
jgi:hypothetical protein